MLSSSNSVVSEAKKANTERVGNSALSLAEHVNKTLALLKAANQMQPAPRALDAARELSKQVMQLNKDAVAASEKGTGKNVEEIKQLAATFTAVSNRYAEFRLPSYFHFILYD